MKCPRCKGKKVIPCIGFNAASGRCKGILLPCILCDGRGTITKTQFKWGLEGEQMYQDRVSREMTLRLESRRRGMKPSVLSEMEMGKIKPVWDKEKHEGKKRVCKQ